MHYPVICLKPNDPNVYWFENERSLKTADKGLVKKGVFDSVSIIDSSGKSYLVKRVNIIGWANRFWGYSIKTPGRSVRIEFDLQEQRDVTLEQLKRTLISKIAMKDLTKEKIEIGFENARSILQLINFFK